MPNIEPISELRNYGKILEQSIVAQSPSSLGWGFVSIHKIVD